MNKYVVVSSKDWFRRHEKSSQFKKLKVIEILNKKKLNISNLKKINPRYIFFIHWNEKVTKEIYENFECIVFHTSPLPFGRGGSPIQNLIIRGIKKSPVCAIKMTKVIAGEGFRCICSGDNCKFNPLCAVRCFDESLILLRSDCSDLI